MGPEGVLHFFFFFFFFFFLHYSETCVREPPLRLTLNSGWCGKNCLSYKGTCHVILLAKLHDMYLYKAATFPHQPLKSILKVALLHRFYCVLLMNRLKGSIFLKNRDFIIQESFKKLIDCIHTIIKCGTWQPVKFQFVSRSWNETTFLLYLRINVANINSEIW